MYINKELKYYEGFDSGKKHLCRSPLKLRELHVGDKDSAVLIFRFRARGWEIISSISIFIFESSLE